MKISLLSAALLLGRAWGDLCSNPCTTQGSVSECDTEGERCCNGCCAELCGALHSPGPSGGTQGSSAAMGGNTK